jgi:hypothetical protein
MQPWGPDHFMEGVLDEEQRLAAWFELMDWLNFRMEARGTG